MILGFRLIFSYENKLMRIRNGRIEALRRYVKQENGKLCWAWWVHQNRSALVWS